MKIPNPWPRVTLRVTCKPGDNVIVLCTRGELEVNDDTCEAIIEPIKDRGRGNYEVLCQGKIWSKAWGLQELEDHMKKVDLENQEAELKERQKKDAEKRVRDAKERGEQEKKDKEAKAKKDKAAKAAKPAKVEDKTADMGKELKL